MKPHEQLIGIIGAALRCEEYSGEINAEGIMPLAKNHQVEHFVANALIARGDNSKSRLLFQTVWLTEQQKATLAEASELLSGAEIDHIPLKGSVLREYYPEAWMRNSCDVDILVKECDLARATELLRGAGYVLDTEEKSAHDVVFTKGQVHLELHYTLVESYRFPRVADVLSRVFEYTYPVSGHRLAMTDEMFYFYHVAHMVKHFENGGCGIRSFTDLYVLSHRVEFSAEKRSALLSEGGLSKFASASLDLAEAWFGDGRDVNEELARFVITGGAYGSTEGAVKVKRARRGGRIGYFLSRLFVPYEQLRRYYPILNRHPYLLPLYEVVRWFSALKRRDVYAKELREGVSAGDGSVDEMLIDLGLK